MIQGKRLLVSYGDLLGMVRRTQERLKGINLYISLVMHEQALEETKLAEKRMCGWLCCLPCCTVTLTRKKVDKWKMGVLRLKVKVSWYVGILCKHNVVEYESLLSTNENVNGVF